MVVSVGGSGSLIGVTLGGYKVEALIGRGAMGTVYLARDLSLKRVVALKVLLGSLARSKSTVRQFHQEAQAAAPLNHANIVRIYSAGVENNTPYIVMEFVDGEPLDRFIKRKGKLPWDVALHIGRQLALALDCAHSNGVIHRDIKPSNVMLDRKGRVRLADFGIARIHADGSGATKPESIIGTPQYMSPEQVSGKVADASSDLFSLGVLLYQLIASDLPFKGEGSLALIQSICEDDPPRLNKLMPEVPDDVARMVAYLMEKHPAKRPASAKVVASMMKRLQRQDDEVSVVHESISSFLQEETEPRPFTQALGRPSRAGATKGSDSDLDKAFAWGVPWHKVARVAAVLLVAFTAFAAPPALSALNRQTTVPGAPALNMALFKDVSDGIQLAHLYIDGYTFHRLSWVGDRPVAMVEVVGIPGTLTHHAVGLLSVDPEAQSFYNVRAPSGPVNDPGHRRSVEAGLLNIHIPPTPEGTLFHDAFPTQALTGASRPAVSTLVQRWDEAAPQPAVRYRATPAQWSRSSEDRWNTAPAARVVLKPDGHTACILQYDSDLGYSYLAERDMAHPDIAEIGPARTTPGLDIVPESIQYTPSGARIAYLRESADGAAELWMLISGGSDQNGRRLATGVVGTEIAISADEQRIALVRRAKAQSPAEIVILDSRSGDLQANLGPGSLSAYAWHRGGNALVVLREDALGLNQLWVVDMNAPYPAEQITEVNTGVAPGYAFSRDGRWLAAIATNENVPTLIFMDWSKIGGL